MQTQSLNGRTSGGHAHGEHDHGHHHGQGDFGRAFAIGIALNTGFVAIEATYGILAYSLALLSDAGHNLSDVLSLLLAWGAATLSQRQPTARHTYGMRRSSILASLTNSVVLLVVIGAIAWEALLRFAAPEPVKGATVIVIAAIGIAVNGATALLFMSGRKSDLNIKAAFLHMAGDAVVSLGVVVAGVAMIATGWLWLDPSVSLVIVLVIAVSTWSLLKDSVNLALDAVPENIDRAAIEIYLSQLPGVTEVHDLHIWAMSTTETAMTVHLIRPGQSLDDALLARATKDLHERFGIAHATLQVETGDPAHACTLASHAVV